MVIGVIAKFVYGRNNYGWQLVWLDSTRAGATILVCTSTLVEVHATKAIFLWLSLMLALAVMVALRFTKGEEDGLSLMLQGYIGKTFTAMFWVPLTILAWIAGHDSRRAQAS